MNIKSYGTHDSVCEGNIEKDSLAIVIDVLRATSSMITALSNGAAAIYPTRLVEEARKLKKEHPNALLCGEREGVMVEGFDLGNSPLEFTKERVLGKALIFTTTNGTSAILKAATAKQVVIASLLNAKAVARAANDIGLPVHIVMAGTQGRFSLDDALAAGAILHHMGEDHRMDDLSITCRALYERYQQDLMEGMRQCNHYMSLNKLGFHNDVAYCVQESVTEIVPEYKDGVLRC